MDKDQAALHARSMREGAEFLMVDMELAFTFLSRSDTSEAEDTSRRNQENARTAYDSILRFLPRSISAFTIPERLDMETKLAELKKRLQELGEQFEGSGDLKSSNGSTTG